VKRAAQLLVLAAGCVLLSGWWLAAAGHVTYWHGVYWALATAATVGYLTPAPAALAPMTIVMLVDIPLLLAVFGVATSAHIRAHHNRALQAMERRLTGQAARHHEENMAAHRGRADR
jgi:hypothetical protein